MRNIVELKLLAHRSRERIRDLGEVFTPESYVEDMLDLLAKDKRDIWSDENISFFEPCCGHGNIVISIYQRRLEGFYKKALTQGTREAAFYAVANALNTLWAIDIDSKNTENCRSRVLFTTLEFLKEKINKKDTFSLLESDKDFFAHIFCAIKWHIEENETLSALSSPHKAQDSAKLTKAGSKWLAQNGHNELDFELTWVAFFEDCDSVGSIPLEYEKSMRFLEGILNGNSKNINDFDFAVSVIGINSGSKENRKINQNIGMVA